MIDREKVVRAVETCFDSWIDGHRNMGLDLQAVKQMKHDALDLLKEQEPVTPKEVSMYPQNQYACGSCGHVSIGTKDYHAKFCPACGRKVKWDEDQP